MILVDRTTNGRPDKLLESKDSQLEEHRDANCSNHDPERLNTLFSKSAQQPDGSGCRIELSQFMLPNRFPVLASRWTTVVVRWLKTIGANRMIPTVPYLANNSGKKYTQPHVFEFFPSFHSGSS